MSDFGTFIKAKRIALGLTLREAARRLDITHNRLAEIERGRSYRSDNPSRPSREVVERMASVYGLPLEGLLAHAGFAAGEASSLTAKEREALVLFGALPVDKQAIALKLLAALSEP